MGFNSGFKGLNWPSLLSGAEDKNKWSYSTTPNTSLIVWGLLKLKNKCLVTTVDQ